MLSEEDKADVKNAMGKAIANKVSKVTRDKSHVPANSNADLIRTARKSRDKGNLPAMGQKILASMSRENSAKSKALQGKGISSERQKEHDGVRTKAIADNWMRKLKND